MLKNLVYNIGSKGAVFISQFIALILTNHIIGPEGRGIFIAAITWSSTFFTLSHFSLSTGILNLSNKNAENIYKLAYTSAVAALVLGAASFLSGIIIYGIIPSLFNNLTLKYIVLVFATIPFMMLQQYTMAVVQVKGNFRAFNILYAAYGIINLAGITIAWLANETSVDLLIFINLVAWFLTGVISFRYLYPDFKLRHAGDSIVKLFAKTSLAAHIGAIVTFAVSRSDILIINYFCNEKQTGVYGLAVGIVQILLIIPLSIQNLLYHSLLGKSVEEQKKVLLQNSRLTFTIMFFAAAVVYLLSQPLVNLVGGKGFEEAIPLFKYFLPAIVFYSMPMVLATQWNIMGIFRQVNILSMVLLILSLTGNIILVPFIGITGGAVTFLAMAFISFCIHIWFVQKQLGSTSVKDIIMIRPSDIRALLNTR
jgi:O-antigen/teichoic acid export membrane protein